MNARWPQPDFLARRRGPSRLAWLWAATGALVLTVTLLEGVSLQRQTAAQQARLENATRRLASVAPQRQTVPAAAAAPSAKADADAVNAARRVAAHLAHPWGLILSSIEAETPAGLQWLVFDHDSDSPELRLEGLGAEVAGVLAVVDALASRAGWSQVALNRLQAVSARELAGGSGWRFELRASIAPADAAVAAAGAGR